MRHSIERVSTKVIVAFSLLLITSNFLFPQVSNQNVIELINDTNIDTLMTFVRDLSGEDSITIDGEKFLIEDRILFSAGHELAKKYLYNKLSSYNLEASIQYLDSSSNIGGNVIGIQKGIVDSNSSIIVCAHYDSETFFCADDDASGCAAVLECARLLSKIETPCNIIYAFWDLEESALQGSRYYAHQARENNEEIHYVINLEMFGYDSDNDGLIDIHTDSVANSVYLAEYIDNINEIYDLGLKTIIYNPGAKADQTSFWNNNYSAIVFSEAYSGGDFNPYYHTSEDRIDKFNLGYFLKLSKLAVASLSSLAFEDSLLLDVQNPIIVNKYFLYQNYPNPFNPVTIIKYSIPEKSFVTLKVYDILGKEIAILVNEEKAFGEYNIDFDGNNLTSGIYFYQLKAGDFVQTRKAILVK